MDATEEVVTNGNIRRNVKKQKKFSLSIWRVFLTLEISLDFLSKYMINYFICYIKISRDERERKSNWTTTTTITLFAYAFCRSFIFLLQGKKNIRIELQKNRHTIDVNRCLSLLSVAFQSAHITTILCVCLSGRFIWRHDHHQ